MLTLGWLDTRSNVAARLHAGRTGARIGRFSDRQRSGERSGRMIGFAASRAWHWRGLRWTPELGWYRVRTDAGSSHSEARVGVRVQLPLSGRR